MFCKLKNEKGVALVTVLVISAVMLILGTVLMTYSLGDLKNNLESQSADFTYIGADSAVQQSFNVMDQIFSNPTYASSKGAIYHKGTAGAEADFADAVKGYIKADLNSLLKDTPADGTYEICKKLDITGNTSNQAEIESYDVAVVGTPTYNAPPYMLITFGVTAKVKYSPAGVSPQTKEVYGQRQFKVYVAKEFFLRGPIYTLGDFMTYDSANVSVQGDVHVYGTTPQNYGNDDQNYYGGIYAKSSSKMTINGNAYCRSDIRTGDLGVEDSGSRIDITKDAFAQSIQMFSNNSNILVYRNAYTLDDLEMNGQNSVIAVNGNYFGLSPGTDHPDEASAIINSSPINDYNDGAIRSRIAVNGDVIINGSAWRYSVESGNKIKTINTIEDAATAWLEDGPMFMAWNPDGGPSSKEYKTWIQDSGYDNPLGNKPLVNGYGNLFQELGSFNAGNVDTWLTNLRTNVIKPGGNNITAKTSIEGYCHNMMAANNTIYYNWGTDIEHPQNLKSYVLDNFDPQKIIIDTDLNFKTVSAPSWTDFWNDAVNDYNSNYPDYMGVNIALLKDKIEDELDIFINRSEYSSTSLEIKHPTNLMFSSACDSLNYLRGSNAYFRTASKPAGYTDYTFDVTPIMISSWTNPKSVPVPYYVLFNDDPSITINLANVTFNGIIFTKGKVTLSGNATVNGAIIAAGKGTYQTKSAAEELSGGVCNAPSVKSDGTYLDLLNNGSFAAVYCTGTGNAVNFPGASTGTDMKGCRDGLITDIFWNQEKLDLNDIFK